MMRVHQGMSMEDRRQARQEILDAHLTRAREAANRVHRSLRCQQADLGLDRHEKCQGEMSMGTGCLCECHDPAPVSPPGQN